MNPLKLLVILSLILFPFGELLRFEIGNNITLRPLDIVVGITAILFILTGFLEKQKRYRNHALFLPVISFTSIGFLALLINALWLKPQDFFASFLYLLRWVSYAIVVFIVSQFDERFKSKIATFLFIDGLLILLLGYLQYFFYPNLNELYYLGWDEHMHRMFSVFFDPNFAGGFFVLYFLFIAGSLYDRLQNKKERNILLFILLVTLIAIFLTFSRAAILMLIVGSAIFLFLIKKKKFILVILGAIVIFVITFSSQFYIENINLFREASSKARIDNYTLALRIIQDRPIFGVGFNSYRYAKSNYGIASGWTNAPSHADAGVDNSFLFVLATTGIIGLSIYLWLWKIILKDTYIRFKKQKNVIALVILSSTGGLFIHALFINSLFFAPLMLWMWMIIGLCEDK